MAVPDLDIETLWKSVNPDERGLVPCITQDLRTRAVLMMAWVSKEALAHSLTCGNATYWSRSRQTLWEKGKTSGNTQRLVHVRLDCDGDTLLYLVEAKLPACHEGSDTCFSRRRVGNGWAREAVDLTHTSESEMSPELETALAIPAQNAPEGPDLAEQTQALQQALDAQDDARIIARAADLIFDVAAALRTQKLSFRGVYRELERRLNPG